MPITPDLGETNMKKLYITNLIHKRITQKKKKEEEEKNSKF